MGPLSHGCFISVAMPPRWFWDCNGTKLKCVQTANKTGQGWVPFLYSYQRDFNFNPDSCATIKYVGCHEFNDWIVVMSETSCSYVIQRTPYSAAAVWWIGCCHRRSQSHSVINVYCVSSDCTSYAWMCLRLISARGLGVCTVCVLPCASLCRSRC
jgi:hypothetical protein